jgi:hypothetical protein
MHAIGLRSGQGWLGKKCAPLLYAGDDFGKTDIRAA